MLNLALLIISNQLSSKFIFNVFTLFNSFFLKVGAIGLPLNIMDNHLFSILTSMILVSKNKKKNQKFKIKI